MTGARADAAARGARGARAVLVVLMALAATTAAAPTAAAAQARAAADEDALARGRALFAGAQPPCAACHTLADAGAGGTVGPSLDELMPDAVRVERALREGFGAMPSYAATLTAAQRRSIAESVSAAAGRAR